MKLENKLNPTLSMNNIEDKVRHGLFNRIRKSLVGKIAAYGLAAVLTFGTGYALSGCGDSGEIQVSQPGYENLNRDTCVDNDNDGFYSSSGCSTVVDCNDNNADINPGSEDDCLDCDDTTTCSICIDADSDAYGVQGTDLTLCTGSTTLEDCDDNNVAVYPNAPERCDGTDNQCNCGELGYGAIDELCAGVIVNLPDPSLDRKVRLEIGKPVGDIYAPDLSGMDYLDASESSISNLSGLEYCADLTNLSLAKNQIPDISPLCGLNNLNGLHLADNQISDISSLSGLGNLTNLYLSKNQISDISPLSGLTNLNKLWLHYNQVIDVSSLFGLTNLTELALDYNQISDISPLSGLTNLSKLTLRGNQISDLSPLSRLTNLNELQLYGNQIIDIQALVNNPGIGKGDLVVLTGNPLSSDACSYQVPALQGRGVRVRVDYSCP